MHRKKRIMTIDELRTLTRDTILVIDKGGPAVVEASVVPVRLALAERGRASGCHVGLGRELTPDETVEWYAGQLLEIVDKKAWFAMNTLSNLRDYLGPACS